jgi:hypothetical protein
MRFALTKGMINPGPPGSFVVLDFPLFMLTITDNK